MTDDLPEEVTETIGELPSRPLSTRDLRGAAPGPARVVAVPDDPEDARQVRFHFPDTDVVARFDPDTEEWAVESVESP